MKSHVLFLGPGKGHLKNEPNNLPYLERTLAKELEKTDKVPRHISKRAYRLEPETALPAASGAAAVTSGTLPA